MLASESLDSLLSDLRLLLQGNYVGSDICSERLGFPFLTVLAEALEGVCFFFCVSAGFEGCSMVPSIYPLETLHNALSLRQVNDFLTALCRNCSGSSHPGAPTGTSKREGGSLG